MIIASHGSSQRGLQSAILEKNTAGRNSILRRFLCGVPEDRGVESRIELERTSFLIAAAASDHLQCVFPTRWSVRRSTGQLATRDTLVSSYCRLRDRCDQDLVRLAWCEIDGWVGQLPRRCSCFRLINLQFRPRPFLLRSTSGFTCWADIATQKSFPACM